MEGLIYYIDWVLLILTSIALCQQLFSKKFNLYGIISLLSITSYIAIHSLYSGFNNYVLIMFICAIALIILEMFMPGGILGTIGIITILISIVTINENTEDIAFIIISSLIIFYVAYVINRKLFNRDLLFLKQMVLDDALTSEKGYVASESDLSLIGKKLITLTDLRPSGSAMLDSKKYDVVTEGEFIEKNNEVEVVKVEGMRIVVR